MNDILDDPRVQAIIASLTNVNPERRPALEEWTAAHAEEARGMLQDPLFGQRVLQMRLKVVALQEWAAQ